MLSFSSIRQKSKERENCASVDTSEVFILTENIARLQHFSQIEDGNIMRVV